MVDPEAQLLYSRSARDLMALARRYPDLRQRLAPQRPVLVAVERGLSELEAALDAERRQLIHANEERLMKYMTAAERWAEAWPEVAREITGKPLPEAHQVLAQRAEGVLPFALPGGPP